MLYNKSRFSESPERLQEPWVTLWPESPPRCVQQTLWYVGTKQKNKTALCDFSHLPHDNSIKLINTQPTESNSQCSPTRNHSARYCYLNRVLLRRCLHSENRGIYKDPALSLHPFPRRADGIFCAAKNWGFKTQDAKSCCTAETSPEIKWNEKKKNTWNALPCQFESSREKKTLVRNHGLKSEY